MASVLNGLNGMLEVSIQDNNPDFFVHCGVIIKRMVPNFSYSMTYFCASMNIQVSKEDFVIATVRSAYKRYEHKRNLTSCVTNNGSHQKCFICIDTKGNSAPLYTMINTWKAQYLDMNI